jgi:hypothetical protein
VIGYILGVDVGFDLDEIGEYVTADNIDAADPCRRVSDHLSR